MATSLPIEDDSDFDYDFDDLSDTLDYSQQNLTDIDSNELISMNENPNLIKNLQLNLNSLLSLPNDIDKFQSLITLDVSYNQIAQLPPEISTLKNLKNFYAKNNCLDEFSLPKEMTQLQQLEVINLGGNYFKQFPYQLLHMLNLREIYLSSNKIATIPDLFHVFTKTEALYLDGNEISHIPDSMGYMSSLVVLNLCNNRLRTLPNTIFHLTRLKSLSLHNNQFSALPPDIIRLDLEELSLRNNPLVVRFVRDLTYDVPKLKELSARIIKLHNISYVDKSLPKYLIDYLNSAKSCLNPKCKGVYFETCHKNIKFVDFCGKFYLPLLQFLCSPACTSIESSSQMATANVDDIRSKFKKVLLG